MLHIVNKSPTQTSSLAACLRLAKDGQSLLLIEDAVLAATGPLAESSGLAAATRRLKCYVLQPDVAARGMNGRLASGITPVDYVGFVDLVANHSTNQTWL